MAKSRLAVLIAVLLFALAAPAGAHRAPSGHKVHRVHGYKLWRDLEKFDHRFPAHRYGTGYYGYRMSIPDIQRLADWAAIPPIAFRQIAQGESFRYVGIWNFDPNGYSAGRGLWQDTYEVWGSSTRRYMARLGGIPVLFNPVRAALMTRYLYLVGGLSPWNGTRYLTAYYDRPHRAYPGGPTLPGFPRHRHG